MYTQAYITLGEIEGKCTVSTSVDYIFPVYNVYKLYTHKLKRYSFSYFNISYKNGIYYKHSVQ